MQKKFRVAPRLAAVAAHQMGCANLPAGRYSRMSSTRKFDRHASRGVFVRVIPPRILVDKIRSHRLLGDKIIFCTRIPEGIRIQTRRERR